MKQEHLEYVDIMQAIDTCKELIDRARVMEALQLLYLEKLKSDLQFYPKPVITDKKAKT
jgi:hypothetical protein